MTSFFTRYKCFFFGFFFRSHFLENRKSRNDVCQLLYSAALESFAIHNTYYNVWATVYIYIFNATAVVCRVSRKNKTKRIFKKIPRPSTVTHSKTSKGDYHHPSSPPQPLSSPFPSPPPRNHNNNYYTQGSRCILQQYCLIIAVRDQGHFSRQSRNATV